MGARAGSNLCNTVGTKKATARATTASGPKAYLRTESRGKGTAGTVAAAMRASAPAGVQTRSKTRVSSPAANGHKFSVKAKASSEASAGTEKIFTVPTILTLSRVAAIPFVVLAYTRQGPGAVALCTSLYVLACFTDWLDGYIARKTGAFSKFGAFLDPVSDKLMVTVILILVTYSAPPEGLCAQFPALVPFSAGVIICREVAMSALREWAASAGSNVRSAVAVNNLGKYKTALQMSSLGFLLACKEGCGGNPVLEALSYAGPAFLLASAVLATYSFLVYFSNVWKFMVGPTS